MIYSTKFRKKKGIALLLVVLVMAAAAVMGMAVLASAALQMQVSGNNAKAAAADALAESGINLAMYYLANPSQAPSLNSYGYWSGQNNISLGSSVNGSVNVTISAIGSPSNYTYSVQSVGQATSASGATTLSRTITSTIKLNRSFQVNYAGTFSQTVALNSHSTFTGDLLVNGTLTLPVGASVNGTANVKAFSGGGYVTNKVLLPSSYSIMVPTPSQIRSYTTYTYNGQTYNATFIASDLQNITLGPTVNNPAGIYWTTSGIKLNGNVTINGSLILKNAQLSLRGANNKITPASGFPGLIADQGIQMWQSNKSLTVNGLVYLGNSIANSGTTTGTTLTVNGGLIMGGGTIDPNYSGSIIVNYVKDKVNVPDLSQAGQNTQNLSVLSWN